MNKKLEVVTGQQLMDMELNEPKFISENILPAGLHILAGSQKSVSLGLYYGYAR